MEVNVLLHSPAALSPGEERAVVTVRKHLWVKAVFWMWRLKRNIAACAGNRTDVIQSVVSRLIDW